MSQETPTEHSDLVGGSTARRRMKCPGSLKRERKAPKSRGSSYAREGTALHEMIAQVLDNDHDPMDMLPFTHNQHAKGNEHAWSLTIDKDKWLDLGQPALDMFDDFLTWLEDDQDGAPAVFMVEEAAEFPGIPGAFGTSDVPFKCGKIGGIWDWKFGRVPVSAEDNAQLMFYFRACLNKYPKFFEGVERVILCISQPAVNDQEPDTWETDIEDIMAFELELQDAIELAMTDDAPIEKGGWCQFADCKAVCELHVGAASTLGSKIANINEKRHVNMDTGTVNPQVIADMGDYLAEAMELAEMAEDWAKHIAKMTQERLEAGLPVEGYKLVPKRSSGRDWDFEEVSEKNIIARLRRRKLVADDYLTPRKLKSPAQVEKALKLRKDKDPLQDDMVFKKPSSGYTLTREGDPRQTAVPPHKRAVALGAALQRKTGALDK